MTTHQSADAWLERAIYAVRADTEGHRVYHCIARRAFLNDVITDERTRRLFAYWGELTGIDDNVAEMSARLDAAAQRAGLSHRSEFLTNDTLDAFLPTHELEPLKQRGDQLLEQTLHQRWLHAQGFVVAELYGTVVDEEVPIRAWLASDLLQVFQEELSAKVMGRVTRVHVPLPPAMTHVRKRGQKPKNGGALLELWTHWNYRHRVAQPRATLDELASEWMDARHAEGVQLAPRDYRPSQKDRPDTKTVRKGIEVSQWALELTIPPEEWAAHFAKFWPDRGGKTPM
ncbi:MAG: hypothetical protein ACREUZ_01525 [Burkholderiales bacterium]